MHVLQLLQLHVSSTKPVSKKDNGGCPSLNTTCPVSYASCSLSFAESDHYYPMRQVRSDKYSYRYGSYGNGVA